MADAARAAQEEKGGLLSRTPFGNINDLFIGIGVIVVVVMMIIPLPAVILDVQIGRAHV